jgi:hypothetical protein
MNRSHICRKNLVAINIYQTSKNTTETIEIAIPNGVGMKRPNPRILAVISTFIDVPQKFILFFGI